MHTVLHRKCSPIPLHQNKCMQHTSNPAVGTRRYDTRLGKATAGRLALLLSQHASLITVCPEKPTAAHTNCDTHCNPCVPSIRAENLESTAANSCTLPMSNVMTFDMCNKRVQAAHNTAATGCQHPDSTLTPRYESACLQHTMRNNRRQRSNTSKGNLSAPQSIAKSCAQFAVGPASRSNRSRR